MSEDSGDKPFKPLKLTSLKAASSAAVGATESANPGEAAAKSPASASAPVAAASSSALKPFKLAATPRAAEATPVAEPPAEVLPTPSGERAPEPVTLNPLNISAEAPASAESGAKSTPGAVFKPLSFTSAAGAVPVAPVEPAPVSLPATPKPSLSRADLAPEKKAGDAAAAPAAAPAATAADKAKKKRVLIALGVFAVLLLAVVAFFLSGKPADAPVKADVPVKTPPVEPKEPVPPVDAPDATKQDPVGPVAPTPDAPTKEPVVVQPRSRKPELETWLKSAVLSTVTPQRIALNDKAYSLNEPVNPERTLRWIGRDSVTRELLFVDDDGIVYSKPTLASVK